MTYSFIIYGQPATKKNSATMVQGRSLLLPSKTYKEYEKVFRQQLQLLPDLPHFQTGVQVSARYYLKDRAHYPDLVGLMQATADLMSDDYKTYMGKRRLVKEWLLSDDRIIKSWDGTRIAGIDKAQPRVEIHIQEIPVNIDEETDPYIVRLLKEKQEIPLF